MPLFSAARVIKQHILPAQYEDVVGDGLINLAVVLEDMATQERALASEEFNVTSSQLIIEVKALSCSWIRLMAEISSLLESSTGVYRCLTLATLDVLIAYV